MQEVKIIGVGLTPFGRFPDRSLKDLAREACQNVFFDAAISPMDLQAAFVANAMAGIITGQECIRGQVMLRPLGIGDIPVINIENACASSSSAMLLAWMAISSGQYDAVLVLGVEKLCHPDRARSYQAIAASMDLEQIETWLNVKQDDKTFADVRPGQEHAKDRSVFMDFYAMAARMHMASYGTSVEQLAALACKNHFHGSLNPYARYRKAFTEEEILRSPLVAYPLTRLMCSPIGDGGAAAILCSADYAKARGKKDAVTVAAVALGSGVDRQLDEPDIVARVGGRAFEIAGLGPEDIDVAELHDATAFGELMATEELGFCPRGEGGPFAAQGHTRLGGKLPVNTSGGLESRGHPVGATGVAQVAELVHQLQNKAGLRQVQDARVGLAQNGGGAIGVEAAAMAVTILTR
ncbi:MAG TPA: thiolase family protein [bacterium]|nr:thiolase family protein [bacterium]